MIALQIAEIFNFLNLGKERRKKIIEVSKIFDFEA